MSDYFFKTRKLKARWENHIRIHSMCKECPLHKSKINYCFGRGELPARLLFVGEGPGKQEDASGRVFTGRSGKLLDSALSETCEIRRISYFITNLVACRPCDGTLCGNRAPSSQEVEACRGRLRGVISMCSPSIVVCLGRIPEDYLSGYEPRTKYLAHPSYILRQGGKKARAYETWVDRLHEICDEVE